MALQLSQNITKFQRYATETAAISARKEKWFVITLASLTGICALYDG